MASRPQFLHAARGCLSRGPGEQDLLCHLPLSPTTRAQAERCGVSSNIPEPARDTAVQSSSSRQPRSPRGLRNNQALPFPLCLLNSPNKFTGKGRTSPQGPRKASQCPSGRVHSCGQNHRACICFSTPRLSPGPYAQREGRPVWAREWGHPGAWGSPMDQVGERLDQLLAQPWLQGGQSTKLGKREAGGSLGAGVDRTDSDPIHMSTCPRRSQDMPGPSHSVRKGEFGRDTCQFDNFNEDPVVGRGGHQLEEERGKGQVVLGVAPGQLADDVDGR